MRTNIECDVLVIGGGLAGLYATLHLKPGLRVIVVDKGAGRPGGSSPLAQGGIAAALGPDDSVALHVADTLRAGTGVNDLKVVETVCDEVRADVGNLIELGCRFDTSGETLHLHREGGQTVARSVHNADATGREIMRVLVPHAKRVAERLPGSVLQLLTSDGECVGARVRTEDGDVDVHAPAVLLTVGGCGALYASTTNEERSTGDGIALAWEAGATVADLEYVQFHPTALATGVGAQRWLLTEALRGDGATLVDAHGTAFMPDLHPDADLAPRDVVARAIASQNGAFLDLSAVPHLERDYPNVLDGIRAAGVDPLAGPVPVAPAAHYHLGGVRTNLHGATDLPGLWSAGECARTGLHGANRLASNSLAEALVFGRRCGVDISVTAKGPPARGLVAPTRQGPAVAGDPVRMARLRRIMWDSVGLFRDAEGLGSARNEISEAVDGGGPYVELAGLSAQLIRGSALARLESRGTHHRTDYPQPEPAFAARIVVAGGRTEPRAVEVVA